jgi:hypothetical protein
VNFADGAWSRRGGAPTGHIACDLIWSWDCASIGPLGSAFS